MLGQLLGNQPQTVMPPAQFAIHHLGIDSLEIASTKSTGPATSLVLFGNLLRLEMQRHAGRIVVGSPGDGLPPTWTQLEIGADANSVRHQIADIYAESDTFGPTLIVLDDIDLVLGHRDGSGDNTGLADFLATLDGVRQREDILTIATTNDPKSIDPAAQRSNRFDMVITLPKPDEASRARILARHLAPLGLPLDIQELARVLDGATGADVKQVIRRAVLEHGRSFTQPQFVEIAESGRWKATVNRRKYL